MSKIELRHKFSSQQQLLNDQGDITQTHTEAIVNAANKHLAHGSGIAAVISRSGGHVIQKESRDWVQKHGLVTHDSPAYTSAGDLPFKYIIHAVGPPGSAPHADQKLKTTILSSLLLAVKLGVTSLAFPAISTGIFGFPKKQAGENFMHAIDQFFTNHPDSIIKEVVIVLFSQSDFEIFSNAYHANFNWKP